MIEVVRRSRHSVGAIVCSAVALAWLVSCSSAPIYDRQPTRSGIGTLQEQDYSPQSMYHNSHYDFNTGADGYRPDIWGSVLYQGETGVPDENRDFELFQVDGAATYPWVVDPDIMVRLGGEFQMRSYDFDRGTLGASDEELFKIGAFINTTFFPDPDWRVEIDFRPGIYSDLNGTLTSKDWRWFLRGVATWRFRDDLYFKFGAENSELFRDVNAYPMVGLAWIINDSWRVDIMVPRKAEVSWALDADHRTRLFGGLTLEGEEFRRRTRTGSALGIKREADVQVQELRLGIGGIHRFTDNLSFFARGGMTLSGDYHWVDSGGNVYDGAIDPEFFLQVGIAVDL